MRDLILFLIIFGSVPIILVRPWVGVIMWCWISYMNPHRMSWGMMYHMPVAMTIGVATLIGWILCKEDRRLQKNAITVIMILLIGWVAVTTVFAVEPGFAQFKLTQFFKTILMTVVALTLIKSEKRLNYYIWIAVISIGYFSFKGGIFTVMTGGNFRVWGPPDSNIMGNNALAMATLMVLPLMVYLGQTATNRWVRIGMYTCAAFSLVSAAGSYSRGALVGMGGMAVAMWWRSKNKLAIGTATVIVVVLGMSLAPQKWLNRMDTIENYEQDRSATGRLEIWGHAIRIANDRPLIGGGFGVFDNESTYLRLSPEMISRRNVHSIYFEMLGTQGYVGLLLFLMLGATGMIYVGRIMKRTEGVPGLENEYKLGRMLQLSLVAYAVTGTFLNLSTWDLYYSLLAMVVIQYSLLEKKLARNAMADEAPVQEDTVIAGAMTPALPRYMPGRSFLRRPAN